MRKFRVTIQDTVFDQEVEADNIEHARAVAKHAFEVMSPSSRRAEAYRLNHRVVNVIGE